MKITLENENGIKVVIEQNAEVIYDVMDLIESALLAYSFSPKVIQAGFLSKAAEIENDEKPKGEKYRGYFKQ